MKQTRSLSEFSRLSEFTRLYPTSITMVSAAGENPIVICFQTNIQVSHATTALAYMSSHIGIEFVFVVHCAPSPMLVIKGGFLKTRGPSGPGSLT